MSSAPETEPVVERTSIARATRKHLGLFQYASAGKPATYAFLLAGLATSVAAVSFLLIQGSPESAPSRGNGPAFSFLIPALGQPEVSLPPQDTYDRAVDAKNQAVQNKVAGIQHVPVKLPGPKLISRPRNVQVPPGTFIEAVLISGASNGLVKAALKDPIEVGGEVLVEAGTIAIGQGSSTEDRLYVRFTKLISRDGQSVDTIQAEAADMSDKIPGLKGSTLNSHALNLAAGIGLDFAAGLSQGFQQTQGEYGAVVTMPNVRNALLQGTARASLDESTNLMNKVKNEKPQIAVESGKEIYLLFSDNGS